MKKSKYSARLKSNRGQAVIEYVLMLIISVSLVLMLVTQIFKPMQAFMQSFMGDYLACLLETGELPNLGQETASNSECKISFQNVNGNSSASSKSSSSNTDPSKSSSSSSSKSSSNNGNEASSSGNSTSAGSSSRRGTGNYVNSIRTPKTGIDGAGAPSGKVVEIALENGGAGGFFNSSNGSRYIETTRKVASVPISGFSEEERKKLEKKAQAGNKTTAVSGEGFAPPPKRIAVKKPEAKLTQEAPDEPLTFGNFIRYLFIAALVIALLVFLGGQALQFSKSSEK